MAADPRIDALRERMEVTENPTFTEEYFDPKKRAIGNAVQVFFKDGTQTDRVHVDYPIGHRRRRDEGIPVLIRKFERAIAGQLSARRCAVINELCEEQVRLENTPVNRFMDLFGV